MEAGHVPVMVEEVMQALSLHPGSFQVDATVGGGGHAARILEATAPGGRLLGLDADPAALERAGASLARFGDRVTLRHANFEQLGDVVDELGAGPVDGILLDLGLSSNQLADAQRGFSFAADGPLDMRFDVSHGEPASALVARLSQGELAHLFREYGEESFAGRIARVIVESRAKTPIESARQLADLVERAVRGAPSGRRRIHPATRVFQALRVAVNRELDVLPAALEAGVHVLRPGGRLVVLSYHSLEDRIVKRFIAAERRGCVCPPELPVCVCGRQPRLRPVGPSPQRPGAAEVEANPRARSARMRVAERLAA